VILYEHARGAYPAVLAVPKSLSGWTHLAVAYDAGRPTLYVDGVPVGQGAKSASIVHPGLGLRTTSPRHFEGDVAGLEMVTQPLPAEAIRRLVASGVPALDGPPAIELAGGSKHLFWRNGRYTLDDDAGGSRSLEVSGISAPLPLDGPWHVDFPAGLGAPAQATLATLGSLHRHPDPGIRYFSGTATYRKRFTVPRNALGGGKRLILDLGRVEVMAEVRLNGTLLGTLWMPPYQIDVSEALRPGANALELRVTNLWPNRLIGDEQFPAEHDYPVTAFGTTGGIEALPAWYKEGRQKPASPRVTFTTWKHYDKGSPLLESGLLGPVMLRSAVLRGW
jgi:hypothetical protein